MLIQDFRTLQEERTRQHNKLSDAHKLYLATGKETEGQQYDLESYKLAVKESTDKFKYIAAKIIDISKRLEVLINTDSKDDVQVTSPISFIQQIQARN